MARDIRISGTEEKDTVPPWRNRQLRLRFAAGLVVAAVVVLVGLLVVYPRFAKWKKERVLHMAEQYLNNEDYRSAYLLMEQLVHDDPANLRGRRLLARIYEATAPDQALSEWEILTQAEPGNPANFIGYATVVLKVGQFARLPAILGALQKLEPESLAYHRLAAASALLRVISRGCVSISNIWLRSNRGIRSPGLPRQPCSSTRPIRPRSVRDGPAWLNLPAAVNCASGLLWH